MRWWPVAVAAFLIPFSASPPSAAIAQTYQDQVEQLNRDAMEAYNALDINAAGQLLEQALRTAQEGGLAGRIVAVTNLNLAMVYIGGLGDQQGGHSYFLAAICLDPSVELDPLISTPDMQLVYGQAQLQAQQGACGGMGAPHQQSGAAGLAPQQAVIAQPPVQPIVHIPPTEQATQTPLPLYVEVAPSLGAVGVSLYYRGLGMDAFKRVQMFSFGQGMAYQITCNDVFEPLVSYYIEAIGGGGQVLARVGSAAVPVDVAVSTTPTQALPALPGLPSPASCVVGECPPGLKCQRPGTAGIGDACEQHPDCQSGLVCGGSDECVLEGGGGTEVGSGGGGGGWSLGPEGDPPRLFFQLGLALGFAYAGTGMPADRLPSLNQIYVDDTTGEFVPDPLYSDDTALLSRLILPAPAMESHPLRITPWVPDADSGDFKFLEYPGECEADGILTTPTVPGPNMEQVARDPGDPNRLPSSYCVRVDNPGFVPSTALRLNAGYFVTERFAPSLVVRLQLGAGEGTLAGVLIGPRAEYVLLGPVIEGLMVSAFGGFTVGQIQVQPPSKTGSVDGAPYIRSGLVGIHAGSTLRYRFIRNVGVFLSPELDLLFPDTLFNLDITLGAEFAM